MQDIGSENKRKTHYKLSDTIEGYALEALLDFSPDAILAVDERGLIVDSNENAEKLLGYDPGELTGRKLESLLPVRYRSIHEGHRAHFFTRLEPRSMADALEVTALKKDGTEIAVDVSLRPIKTAEGPVVLSAIRDVSKRKIIEERYRDTARRFTAIFNATFQFIGLLQPDGILLEVNQTALDYVGSKLEDEINKHFWDCSWWNTIDRERERLKDAVKRAAGGEFVRYEATAAGKDGQICTLDFSLKPVYDDEGNVILLLPEGRDITARKQVEEALLYRDAILEAVNFAAEQFLKAGSWEQCVEEVLARLGEASKVSRVYIFQNQYREDDTILAVQTYEWVAPHTTSVIDLPEFQAVSYIEAGLERWVEVLGKNAPIYGLVRDFPESEVQFLRAQDIKSLAVVPVFVHDYWWGFVGFDECRIEREWTDMEIDSLTIAANTFGAAVRRQEDEMALRASRERFWKAFNLAPVASAMISLETLRFVEVNRSFEAVTAFTPSEVVGSKIADLEVFVHPEVFEQILEQIEERGICHDVELTIRSKTGDFHEMLVSAEVVDEDGERCMLLMLYDVTDRKRLQREIAKLAATEQRQIGYDLHEDLAQQLASTALLSGVQLRKLQEEGSKHAEVMARITGMLSDAIAYSRDLSQRLSPVDIHPEGLMYALRGLAESTESMLGIPCRFVSEQPVLLSDNYEATHVYRIVQEAIKHTVQRGKAEGIVIELVEEGEQGVVRIHTSGVPLERLLEDRIALSQMNHMADTILAKLFVNTYTSNGYTVECRFDL